MALPRKPQTLVERATRLDRERHRLARTDGRETPYPWEQLAGRISLPKSEIEGYRRIMGLPVAARRLLQTRTDLALSTVVVALRHLPKTERAIVARVQGILTAAEQRARDLQDPAWRQRQTERARQQRHAKSRAPRAARSTPTDIPTRLTLRIDGEDGTPSFTMGVIDSSGATIHMDDVALLQQLIRAAAAEITRRTIGRQRGGSRSRYNG